jgi:hypothetical protein
MRCLVLLLVVCICIVMVSGCAQQLTKQEVMGHGEKKFFVDILPPKDAFELMSPSGRKSLAFRRRL